MDGLALNIGDTPYSAPGWREIGQEFTTGEGEYGRDPAVTRAIRAFDPGIIPLWCRWVFLSPQDTGEPKIEVFGRHAIGRYREFSSAEQFGHRGLGYTGPLPNILELILEGDPDPRAGDLPGAYVPWDWQLVGYLRELYTESSAEERKQKFVRNPIADQIRRREKMREEREYVLEDIRRFADRKLEGVGTPDIEERMALIAERSTRLARSQNV